MTTARTAAPASYEELWAHVGSDASRRMLIAALEAFAERGFAGASTRDIAQRVGLSPAAVYVHYRSKADLLHEIARTGHEAVLAEVRRAMAGAEGPAARLRAFVEAFAAWHARFHTLARVIQYELDALPADRRAEIRALRRSFDRLVAEELREGRRTGAFRVEDVAGTVVAILSLGIDVARWYAVDARRPADGIGALYGELVMRMLRP